MQPAPIPPSGIAICVALSPLNVRCGPASNSSSDEYGTCSETGTEGGFETGASGWTRGKGTAAPNAAEEVIAMNSLRVDFSDGDIESSVGTSGQDVPLELLNTKEHDCSRM